MTLIVDSSQVNGLNFLHNNGIVHGDLRAHNIIIDPTGYAKIGNFGRATYMSYRPKSGVTMESRQWIDNLSLHSAPELLSHEIYYFNHAIDMWALGMIVCELQVGKVGVALQLSFRTNYSLTCSRSKQTCHSD